MTQILIDTTDPRDVKALQLATQADQWPELRRGEFAIASATSRAVYRVTQYSCSCADHARGNRCKHMRSVAIFVAFREAIQPKPARVAVEAPFPVAVCEGDETVFLSRREARRRGIAAERPTPSYRLDGEALWARFNGD